jgi:radical SAM protein with 4Fe4S-binding SPASM domain
VLYVNVAASRLNEKWVMTIYKEKTIKAFGEDIHERLGEILGERYTQYRLAWESAKPDCIPQFPIHLDFEFFDLCNQSCSFCPRNETLHNNNYPINTKSKLDWSVVKKVAAEAKENNLYSVNFGAYAEPLVYERIFDAVKLFIDNGVVDTRLITNGLLLNKYYNDIFGSKLLNLYVSLDAYTEETYFKQRGKGFQRVKDNLLGFLDEKEKRNSIFPIVRVSFVENPKNVHEKEDFIEYWKNKVDFIDVQHMIDYTKAPVAEISSKKWNCMDPFKRVSIISTGEVLPCCTFHGRTLAVGDIYKQSIKEIWDGEEIKHLRNKLLNDKSEICNICQS